MLYTNICVYVLFKGKHTLKLKCQCKYRNYVDSVIWAVLCVLLLCQMLVFLAYNTKFLYPHNVASTTTQCVTIKQNLMLFDIIQLSVLIDKMSEEV